MGLVRDGRSTFGRGDPRRRTNALAHARTIAMLERKQAEAARQARRRQTLDSYQDTFPHRTAPPAVRRARTEPPNGLIRTGSPTASVARLRSPRLTDSSASWASATLATATPMPSVMLPLVEVGEEIPKFRCCPGERLIAHRRGGAVELVSRRRIRFSSRSASRGRTAIRRQAALARA